MTSDEALSIIERLKNGCIFHRFDEPGVHAEYVRAISKYNFQAMNKAVDLIFASDSKNVPAISLLIKTCKGIGVNRTVGEVKNTEWCDVCNDRGFILIGELLPVSETEKSEYKVVYYCPFCQMGSQFNYDGSQLSKERSEYKTDPITSIFDDTAIKTLRRENRKVRAKNQAGRDLRKKEKLKGKFASVGKTIPVLKEWEELS